MQNLQNIQSLSSFSRKFGGSVTLQSYIKSLSGLVAYYPMDETSGTTAYNKAPDTLGTLNGTISGATINQDGQSGKCYQFSAGTNVVTIPDTTDSVLDLTNKISAVAIIKAVGYGGNNLGRIFSKGTAYEWFINSSNGMDFAFGGSFTSSSVISLDSWYLVGGTYDATLPSDQIKQYVNESKVHQATRTTTSTPNDTSLHIGNNTSLNRGFNGYIQHVALFNRALTDEEIENLAIYSGFFF